jgi:hypothetical protein
MKSFYSSFSFPAPLATLNSYPWNHYLRDKRTPKTDRAFVTLDNRTEVSHYPNLPERSRSSLGYSYFVEGDERTPIKDQGLTSASARQR